jgi:hypothetical protein
LSDDNIHGWASEALGLMEQHPEGWLKKVYTNLCFIIGATDERITQAEKWNTARELYQDGLPPRAIGEKLGLSAQQIRNKASKSGWLNLTKLNKTLKKAPQKGGARKAQDFIKQCDACHSQFRAKSGNERICNTCQAGAIQAKAGLLGWNEQ